MTKWIDNINGPDDLKKVPFKSLREVAEEYRDFLIKSVSKTGGHLGASLGALELTIALHYVLNSPKDKICWDVGHQAYIHKMITGRLGQMGTLRQPGGLSGFPSPFESSHDPFIVGHAGTSISQALGLAVARDYKKQSGKVVAVIGDGSMTSGLAFEALNNAGHLKKNMMIVLNDNEMAISKNVGAFSKYLNKVITNPLYNRIRSEVEKQLERFPRLNKLANSSLESIKHLVVPGIIFEELGVRYFGPIDGHNLKQLTSTFKDVLGLQGCTLVHVITQKGKGCDFAEADFEKSHGVAPFDIETGEKTESGNEKEGKEGISYTEAFSRALLKVASKDSDIVAITAAMLSGTGLTAFQKKFPKRFFDVGIAEGHAVTFAGALAKGGLKPVCAIYSTFLQRSLDSLMHDIALQRQPTVLALDRAGIVGADGATHNGVFDISYIGHIPGSVIGAPKDEHEMERMMELAMEYENLFALRYPRANIPEIYNDLPKENFAIGEAETIFEGRDGSLLALGSMVEVAMKAHKILKKQGVNVKVVNMRFAKPLDEKIILDSANNTKFIFTLEEHVACSGFGTKVLEFLEAKDIREINIKRLALPDAFIEHGSRKDILDQFGLSPEKVAESVLITLNLGSSVSDLKG